MKTRNKQARAEGISAEVKKQGETAAGTGAWRAKAVPVLNGDLPQWRMDDLHLVMGKVDGDIKRANDKPLAEGMAMLRALRLSIEHHPDLGRVAEALEKIERGAAALIKYRAEPELKRKAVQFCGCWLEEYLIETAPMPCWKVWLRLEGLGWFLLRSPGFKEIGRAVDRISEGFSTLLAFEDETNIYFDMVAGIKEGREGKKTP